MLFFVKYQIYAFSGSIGSHNLPIHQPPLNRPPNSSPNRQTHKSSCTTYSLTPTPTSTSKCSTKLLHLHDPSSPSNSKHSTTQPPNPPIQPTPKHNPKKLKPHHQNSQLWRPNLLSSQPQRRRSCLGVKQQQQQQQTL